MGLKTSLNLTKLKHVGNQSNAWIRHVIRPAQFITAFMVSVTILAVLNCYVITNQLEPKSGGQTLKPAFDRHNSTGATDLSKSEALHDNVNYDVPMSDKKLRYWFDIIQGESPKLKDSRLFQAHFPQVRDWVLEQHYQKLVNMTGGGAKLNQKPVHLLIVSSWRTGSSLTGELLQANPGTFYHFEPLTVLGHRLRRKNVIRKGVQMVNNLFNCEYSKLMDYFRSSPLLRYFTSTQNEQLTPYCKNLNFCIEASFLSRLCEMHAFRLIKTVRMPLRHVKPLLDNERLNLKVVLLVRDPRGTMSSRRHIDVSNWCQGTNDCRLPSQLCKDLEDDFHAAKQFREEYANKFTVLRYEDLSLNPHFVARKLFTFLGLEYKDRPRLFVNSHMEIIDEGRSNQYQNATSLAFRWLQSVTVQDLIEIQPVCRQAMAYWGYKPLPMNTVLKNDPIDYTLVLGSQTINTSLQFDVFLCCL